MDKKLKVSNDSNQLLYKHINRFHLIGELIIIAVSLIALYFMRIVWEWRSSAYQDVILVVAVLHAFRSVVERCYKKDSKQHLLSAYASVNGLLLFLELSYLRNNTISTVPIEINNSILDDSRN